MVVWELIESRMKILGAVNLLTAFPPLANALIISLYASDAREEAEVRGWPPEVYELVKNVKERVSYEAISEVLNRLSSNQDFIENLGYMVYYDLAEKSDKRLASTAYNFISALDDVGFNLSPHILCLDIGYAERLASLSGGPLEGLRAMDITFIVKIRSSYSSEPLEAGESESYDIYVCSPKWVTGVKEKIYKLIEHTPDSSLEDVKQLLLGILDSNRRLYSYLRLAYAKGAMVAWRLRGLVKTLPGRIETVRPLLDVPFEDSIPAINYSLREVVVKAMDSIREGSLAGDAAAREAWMIEDIPLIYSNNVKEAIVKLREHNDKELLKALAERLNARIESVAEGYYKLVLGGSVE